MTADTRIMKRHSGDQPSVRVAFQFEDVQVRCDEYKTQVKAECRQVVLEAQRQADEIRGRAQDDGYRDGLTQADAEIAERSQRRADELVEERLSAVVPAVSEMLDELSTARSRCRLDWETELVGTAVAIAEKIIGRSLETHPELAAGVSGRAVELALGSTALQIQLNPADLKSLGDRIRALVQNSSHGIDVQLIPDQGISPGGCLVVTEHGQVDGRLETMLDRISSELLDGLE